MTSVMQANTKYCFVADSDLRSTVAAVTIGGMVNAAQDLTKSGINVNGGVRRE